MNQHPLASTSPMFAACVLTRRGARWLAGLAVACSILSPLPALSGTLTLATKPLANSASASVPPNLMFVLDTSGSMGWDFSPDYVEGGNTTAYMCYDNGDVGNSKSAPYISDNRRAECNTGNYDPPYTSPDFNKQYYNPDYTYPPGVNYDGTSKGNQPVTAARNDPYLAPAGATTNLTTSYPGGSWCRVDTTVTFSTVGAGSSLTAFRAKDDAGANYNIVGGATVNAVGADNATRAGNMAAAVRDLINAQTTTTGYSAVITVAGSNVMTLNSRPGVKPSAGFISYTNTGTVTINHNVTTSCIPNSASNAYVYPNGIYKYRGGNVNSNPYYYRIKATEYCSDSKLTTCINSTVPVGSFTYPAQVRFCKNPSGTTPLTDCQGKYDVDAGYTTAKYVGYVIPTTGGKAWGLLSIGTVVPGLSITAVEVSGVNIMTVCTATATAADNTSTMAVKVFNCLDASATRLYDKSVSGNTITLTSRAIGIADNGRQIVATTSAASTPGVFATATLTVNPGAAGIRSYRLPDIRVSGSNITSGVSDFTGDLSLAADRAAFAAVIASRVTQLGYTATHLDGMGTPTDVVTITAPSVGSSINGTVPTLGATAMGKDKATGTITVFGALVGDKNYRYNTITVGAANIVNPITSFTWNGIDLSTATDQYAVADLIANRINAAGTHSAVRTLNQVDVTANTAGTAGNLPLAVNVPAALGPSTNLSISSVTQNAIVTSLVVSGVELLSGATAASCTSSTDAATRANTLDNGPGCLIDRINANTGTSQFTAATCGANCLTITGPSTLVGASPAPVVSLTTSPGSTTTTGGTFSGGYLPLPALTTGMAGGTDFDPVAVTFAAFSGGVNPTGLANHSTQAFANGNTGSQIETRAATGTFQRCDIKSGQNCLNGNNFNEGGAGRFPRSSERYDCVTSTLHCTYAEEAQNFANWYSYYRTRMLAMKSAAGLAFSAIGTDFRVGLMSIWSDTTAHSQYLKVDSFTGGAGGWKQQWYNKFYAANPSGGTPLRRALARSSQMFAHRGPFAADDPVQYSCQQNFVLFTTDGYWNTDACSEVTQLDGSTQIGNQDNATSVRAPYFDGGFAGDTCQAGGSSTASSAGNLADVSYYYYQNDLRTGTLGNCTNGRDGVFNPLTGTFKHDVCANNVQGGGNDTATYQHVTTYTLGLGVDGNLEYRDDYLTATTGDYFQISRGVLNWPKTKPNNQTTVDDLWHTAVNGRGRYLSAKNPALLAKDLNKALTTIKSQLGAGAAASTSNLDATQSETSAYVPSYTTVQWTGNLSKQDVKETGELDPAPIWCVEDIAANTSLGTPACVGKLQTQVGSNTDTRQIFLAPGLATPFLYASMTAAQKANFNPALLSQYLISGAPLQANMTGTSLVNYLRGQRDHEDESGNPDADKRVYRDRVGTLGDAVGSRPVYVGAPRFSYTDPGYATYKAAQAGRSPTIYLGTNDGFLHAFNDTGLERWAFVPDAVLPELWRLADSNYATNHRYYVDGTAVTGDICTANCTDDAAAVWKTILVSGFGGGGKGYFALDITNPAAPSVLWQFADADTGYSYGNPIITKRLQTDGTKKWVLVFTSGYNNGGTGSGNGILYVLDAVTGLPLQTGSFADGKLKTNVGSPGSPSGLSRIEALINDVKDNLATYIYGGDLEGNVWRFKINQEVDPDATKEAKMRVAKIAVARDTSSKAQPITTRPVVTSLDDIDQTTYIIVATGLLLQEGDLLNTDPQSLYAFVDKFNDNGYVTVGQCATCGTTGAREQLTQVTLAATGTTDGQGRRTRATTMPGSLPPQPQVQGCMVDLPDVGERVNVDMALVLGTLNVLSNVPTSGVCQASGYSYINSFNYKTCEGLNSYEFAPALGVGLVILQTASGYVVGATRADRPGYDKPDAMANVNPPPTFQGRRIGWRILFD